MLQCPLIKKRQTRKRILVFARSNFLLDIWYLSKIDQIPVVIFLAYKLKLSTRSNLNAFKISSEEFAHIRPSLTTVQSYKHARDNAYFKFDSLSQKLKMSNGKYKSFAGIDLLHINFAVLTNRTK